MSLKIFAACSAPAYQSSLSRSTLRSLSTSTILIRSHFLKASTTPHSATVSPFLLPKSPLLISKSYYASKKGKKGKKGAKVEVEEDDEEDYEEDNDVSKEQEEIGFDLDSYTPKFQACLDKLKRDFQTLRMGRANPALLDPVTVDCGEDFGGLMPLKKVGQVSIKDPQTLMINVFESKLLPKVEKAIHSAELNLSPIIENGRIRVPIPKLTAQSRNEIIKQANQMEQKAKLSVRSVRQNGMKVLTNLKKQKASGISADEIKKLEKEMEALVVKYNKEVDTLTAAKVSEIKG
ncbi:hypothetical protein DSO57_1037504 [Entomophthora muscae]|uniref:Uncharacterized protein n=2 Tax=Entomophthora muscae TaxID=34485 RepID=A0ACC2TA00_9FUNG|nr:hypothetical protein DSO57_1037504 [Entomophthora muscae]